MTLQLAPSDPAEPEQTSISSLPSPSKSKFMISTCSAPQFPRIPGRYSFAHAAGSSSKRTLRVSTETVCSVPRMAETSSVIEGFIDFSCFVSAGKIADRVPTAFKHKQGGRGEGGKSFFEQLHSFSEQNSRTRGKSSAQMRVGMRSAARKSRQTAKGANNGTGWSGL